MDYKALDQATPNKAYKLMGAHLNLPNGSMADMVDEVFPLHLPTLTHISVMVLDGDRLAKDGHDELQRVSRQLGPMALVVGVETAIRAAPQNVLTTRKERSNVGVDDGQHHGRRTILPYILPRKNLNTLESRHLEPSLTFHPAFADVQIGRPPLPEPSTPPKRTCRSAPSREPLRFAPKREPSIVFKRLNTRQAGRFPARKK